MMDSGSHVKGIILFRECFMNYGMKIANNSSELEIIKNAIMKLIQAIKYELTDEQYKSMLLSSSDNSSSQKQIHPCYTPVRIINH